VLSKIIQQLKQQFQQSANKRYLLRGSGAAFIIQISGLAIGFISTWLLARLLGVSGYGTYTYIFAWISLVSSFLTLGFDSLLVREMATFQKKGQLAAQKGIFQFANLLVGIGSFSLATSLYFFLEWTSFSTFHNSYFQLFAQSNKHLFQSAIWAIPLLAILRIWQSTLRGHKQIIRSQLPELSVRPLLFLLSIIAFYLLVNNNLSPLHAIRLNVCSIALALILGAYFIYQKIVPKMAGIQATYQSSVWLKSAFSFSMINLVSLINVRADVLMLGSLADHEAVGMYNIAARLADLLKLLLVVVNLVFSPLIANLHSSGQLGELQKVVTQVTRTVFIISLPLAILLLLFSTSILGLFGADFIHAKQALIILVVDSLVCPQWCSHRNNDECGYLE